MIALYKGKSFWPSRCIEFINWSPYSHAAYIAPDGQCVEAWTDPNMVRRTTDFSDGHTPGTEVDFFRVHDITPGQDAIIYNFMLSQIGKPYDWESVFHFITRRPEDQDDQSKWFCSELVFVAHQKAGINLFERIPAYKVYPGMLAISPLLDYIETRKVGSP